MVTERRNLGALCMGTPRSFETHRLDRAIVAISVNAELGTPVPDTLLHLL